MIGFFEKEGVLARPEGNMPLSLAGGGKVWLVLSGVVDIFGILTSNGEPTGPRVHLFRAEQGEILFSVSESSGENASLLAAGKAGCEVLGLELTRFKELICSEPAVVSPAERAFEVWVSGLSTGVRRGIVPKAFQYLELGKETSSDKGANIRVETSLLWALQIEGTSLFMGKSGLPEIGPGDLSPLCSQAWLESQCEAKYLARETRACLADGSVWPALDLFHGQILKSIALNRQEYEAEEHRRLDVKAADERAAFENSLRRLSSVMGADRPLPVLGGGGHDALMTVCRLIGEAQSISFNAPQDDIPADTDPLDTIAHSSRVRKRLVILKGDWWNQDSGPLLGFIEEDGRPVAILPAKGGYEIDDPAAGRRRMATPEIALELGPFAYMFYRPLPERVLKGWDLFKIGLHGCRKDIFTIILTATLGALLGLAIPIATGIIFDTFIAEAARGRLIQTACILTVCILAGSVFEITKAISLLRIESKVDASLQGGVMDRLLSLPAPFFRKFTAGDLADRALGINEIRSIMSGVAVQTILTGIFSCFYFALMFWYSISLSLVAAGLAVVGMSFTSLASLVEVGYQRDLSRIQGQLFGIVLQFVTGISKIRLSGTENRAFAVWAEQFGQQRAIEFRAGMISNLISTFNSAFPVLSLTAIFFWLSKGESDQISAGSFLGFIAAFSSFQFALVQLSSTLVSTLYVVPTYERAKPILEALPEVDVKKSHPGDLTGDIEISHACFRYSPDGPLVLDDVSFRAKAGEFIALVGTSGSGKSTLLRLLLGFESPEAGAVYYDGQDLSGIDIRALRRQIGVVLQNGRIMAGDIFRNIVGSSNLTIDDAWEAARMAGFEEDIRRMPMGMHTVLSAGSGTLSGGQRQRLMIARAIVRRPRIILFDEATSALDNLTQSVVSRSLERLHATRIVIAHRLSTIINADRIFVLERGKIVQSGSYGQLVAIEGPFLELTKRQLV